MNAKTILSIFVLSVFAVSLLSFVVSAHRDDLGQHVKERLEMARNMVKDRVSNISKLEGLREHHLRILQSFESRQKERLDRLGKDKLQTLAKLPPGLAKMVINNTNFEKMLGNIKIKEFPKNKLEMAFHMRAKNLDGRGTDAWKDHKQKLMKIKENFKQKKADFLSNKTLENAKAYLTEVLDGLIEKVNGIKELVTSSADLTEDQVNKALTDLDSRLTKLNEWKTRIVAATTKEDLKPLLIEIRRSFKTEQSMLKMLNVHGWRVALQHFAGILKQVDHLDSKLNRLLTFAENNNVTIEGKETKVAEFQSKLAEAKKHFQLAVDDFKILRDFNQSALNAPNIDMMSDEQVRVIYHRSIKTHLTEAKNNLKEARIILQSLVKEIVPQLKDAVTDEGEPVEITEQDVLDPTKVTNGVDIEEGETTVEIAQEETLEL